MRQYSAEELNGIFTAIAPQRSLIVPVSSGAPPPALGPAVCVSLRYSEIVPGTTDIESRYWNTLRQTPVVAGIGMLEIH